MVKQISDNETYLLIKYIKSVLWRVAKCLSYKEDARCLKVKIKLCVRHLMHCATCVWYHHKIWQQLSLALLYVPACQKTDLPQQKDVSLCHNMEQTHQSNLTYCSQCPPPFHMHSSAPLVFLTTPSYPLMPSAHSTTRGSSSAYGPCPWRARREIWWRRRPMGQNRKIIEGVVLGGG